MNSVTQFQVELDQPQKLQFAHEIVGNEYPPRTLGCRGFRIRLCGLVRVHVCVFFCAHTGYQQFQVFSPLICQSS